MKKTVYIKFFKKTFSWKLLFYQVRCAQKWFGEIESLCYKILTNIFTYWYFSFNYYLFQHLFLFFFAFYGEMSISLKYLCICRVERLVWSLYVQILVNQMRIRVFVVSIWFLSNVNLKAFVIRYTLVIKLRKKSKLTHF